MIISLGLDHNAMRNGMPDFAVSGDVPRVAAAPERNNTIALIRDLGSETLNQWASVAYER
jgi:hypothetical protein